MSAALVARASRARAPTLRTTRGPGTRSVGSGTTCTGRPSARAPDATAPSSGTTSAEAQRRRSSPRSRSSKLISPPPTMWPWFDTTRIDGGASLRRHPEDSQTVARRGVEVAEDVEARRGWPPEQRKQPRPVERQLAAVEHDDAG